MGYTMLVAGGLSLFVFTNPNLVQARLRIQSNIGASGFQTRDAVVLKKGQKISLSILPLPRASIRWFRICPDLSKDYKNANHPWEKNPYQWIGWAKIHYQREEFIDFKDQWEIMPFDDQGKIRIACPATFGRSGNLQLAMDDLGSFWFQAEVETAKQIFRTAGIEASTEQGLSPNVFRVSVQEDEGYLGFLTGYLNVPGLFGSVSYQAFNYIGVDCADVLIAAFLHWKRKPMRREYNVAYLVKHFKILDEFDMEKGQPKKTISWISTIRPGDWIAVRYEGEKAYQHIGALYADANGNGVLDPSDTVLHAGPNPLHVSRLQEGGFDGHVVVLAIGSR